jgi:hypothetical protein
VKLFSDPSGFYVFETSKEPSIDSYKIFNMLNLPTAMGFLRLFWMPIHSLGHLVIPAHFMLHTTLITLQSGFSSKFSESNSQRL